MWYLNVRPYYGFSHMAMSSYLSLLSQQLNPGDVTSPTLRTMGHHSQKRMLVCLMQNVIGCDRTSCQSVVLYLRCFIDDVLGHIKSIPGILYYRVLWVFFSSQKNQSVGNQKSACRLRPSERPHSILKMLFVCPINPPNPTHWTLTWHQPTHLQRSY